MSSSEQFEKDLMACVHCGLCLNACPTYLETGSEADSPRGRIVLMRGMHEGRLSTADEDVVRHLDRCLGCRACETACPSSVPYGSLLETARAMINKDGVRPRAVAASRWGLLAAMTNPAAMTVAMRVSNAVAGGGVPAMAARLLSGKADSAAQAIAMPNAIAPPLPASFTPAVGLKRYRVGVLTGCVMRVMYGDVTADTVRVLAANGCEVLVNRRQGCCGALHAHNGYVDEARTLAKKLIDAFRPFDGLDAIVVNSAGCGSTMKEYGALLAGDSVYAASAAAFASKVRDVCEFLDDAGWVAPLKPLPSATAGVDGLKNPDPERPDCSDRTLCGAKDGLVAANACHPECTERAETGSVTVAVHDACHLVHGQGVRDAPRRLLAAIPGVRLAPLPESEVCCGSAGIYNLTEPDMARSLQDRKLNNIAKTGASIVATGNPGCLAWIEAGVRRREASGWESLRALRPTASSSERSVAHTSSGKESGPRVVHPVTLLAEALQEARETS